MRGYFPGEPRPQQLEAMRLLTEAWADHDAFAVSMPTGVGKSNVAVALARWAVSNGMAARIITPNSQLQEQYETSFPELPSLWGGDAYRCTKYPKKHCDKACKLKRNPCGHECLWRQTLVNCKRGAGLMHVFTYQGNHGAKKRLPWAELAIFDEAHMLAPYIAGQAGVSLWRFQHRWPDGLVENGDLLSWLQRQPPSFQRARAAKLIGDGAVVVKEYAPYHERLEPRLRIEPLSVRKHPPTLWPPRAVKKVVGLSATFDEYDTHDLGWDTYYRVKHIAVDSPIPPGRRPVHVMPWVPMSHRDQELSTPSLAALVGKVAEHHCGEAGLVHATYDLARSLRYQAALSSPRFMWHDQFNKQRVIADFKRAAEAARILVGSGMHEGLDLAGDVARWQVLTKVPRLDLSVSEVRIKAEKEPEWYARQAIKSCIQACGRVSRGPDDYGVTYIFDPYFVALYTNYQYLFPPWFLNALRWG